MPFRPFEELEVFKLAESLADGVWDIVVKWDYFEKDTVGKQLVQAAEKCAVRIIHPGTPLNPKEKDLDKWVKRAEPFN